VTLHDVDAMAKQAGLHMELRIDYKNLRSRICEFALCADDNTKAYGCPLTVWAHPIENLTSDMPNVTRLAREWLLGKEAAA